MKLRRFFYFANLLFVFVIPAGIIAYLIWGYLELPELLTFLASVTILGSIWDLWATRHGRKDKMWIWQFHKNNTLGIRFFDIPIEEYLFYPISALYIILLWQGIQFGYATGNIWYLAIISTVSIWTLLSLILSFVILK